MQKSTTENEPLAQPEFLSDDPIFIELVADMNSFASFISYKTKEASLDATNVQKKLNELSNKKISTEEQLLEINQIFRTNMSSTLLSHMKVFNRNWSILEKKYPNIEYETLATECSKVLFQVKSPSSNTKKGLISNKYYPNLIASNNSQNDTTISPEEDMSWKQAVCIAGATAGAILCHGGCTASTAGFGLPACVALCGSIQASAILLCQKNFPVLYYPGQDSTRQEPIFDTTTLTPFP